MASPTQWIWVWVNSGSWWWTGRPDVLRFMGSQRVGHDWVTELEMEWITLGIFIARSLSVIFFCFHCVHQANLQYIYCIHWSSTRGHLVPLPFWGTLAPYPRVGPGKSLWRFESLCLTQVKSIQTEEQVSHPLCQEDGQRTLVGRFHTVTPSRLQLWQCSERLREAHGILPYFSLNFCKSLWGPQIQPRRMCLSFHPDAAGDRCLCVSPPS